MELRVRSAAFGTKNGFQTLAIGDRKGNVSVSVVVIVESLFTSYQEVEEAFDEMLLEDVLGFRTC
jgi:hypothetical protein